MTGRAGNRTAVHFPTSKVLSSTETDSTNPLVLFGKLITDCDIVRERLKQLHMDESGLHGNLQVMKAALVRMNERVAIILKGIEG